MTPHQGDSVAEGRPDFMAALGLLPPYTVEDVRMAYREKAKLLHPDRGGSAVEFQKLKEAFDRATEYAQFRTSRRHWLAAQVERYTQQEEVVGEVRRRGGQVEIEQIDWVKRSIGEDFAVVTERLRGIRLHRLADGDAFLRYLAEHKPALGYLNWLDLANSRLSDEGLRPLRALTELRRLNVAGTPISKQGLRILVALPRLEWLNLADTSVGWWTRWRLRWSYPRIRVVTVAAES
jgi:hypothetical protein